MTPINFLDVIEVNIKFISTSRYIQGVQFRSLIILILETVRNVNTVEQVTFQQYTYSFTSDKLATEKANRLQIYYKKTFLSYTMCCKFLVGCFRKDVLTE